MLLNAFKSPADYSTNGPLSWPTEFYTKGLVTYWNQVNYPQKLWNSTVIAGTVAVAAVLISLLNAYAIGIGRVKGRLWIVALFLLGNMIPQEALVYPLYFFAKEVGLYNTQLVVIIIFTVIQSAFGTYLLASVLGTFPKALLEAAALDGATSWQILWKVVFPIVRPTLSVLLIFFFIWTWNEFFIPLVMLIDNATQTIPVALASLQGDRLMDAPDHQRRRADQPDPRGHLLLHLPAHPDSRGHRRRCQIDQADQQFEPATSAVDQPLRHASGSGSGRKWLIDEVPDPPSRETVRTTADEVQRRLLDGAGGLRRPAPGPGPTTSSADGRTLSVLAPTRVIAGRGDTLNRPTATVTLSTPLADVIRVRIEHHAGGRDPGPNFALPGAERTGSDHRDHRRRGQSHLRRADRPGRPRSDLAARLQRRRTGC